MAPLVLGLLRTATRGAWTTLYLRACTIVCLVVAGQEVVDAPSWQSGPLNSYRR